MKRAGQAKPIDFGDAKYFDRFVAEYPSHKDIALMCADLVERAGGYSVFVTKVGEMLRRAIDEVIDMPRTGRWSVQHLHKTEKTYLGTKVEIHLRHLLKLPWGKKLDLSVDGVEVDIKHTVDRNWAIPYEAVGELCLLVKEADASGLYSLGMVRALQEYLSEGRNQDGKRTLNALGRRAIFWIAADRPYAPNFFERLVPHVRTEIVSARSGAERIRRLFRLVQGRVITREVIEGTGQQKDPLKRLRRNGGAPDVLSNEGIFILSGTKKKIVTALGFPHMRAGDFVSVSREEVLTKVGVKILAEMEGSRAPKRSKLSGGR